MKLRLLLFGIICLAAGVIGATTPQSGADRITVHAGQVLAPVNPLLFGQNFGPWMNTTEGYVADYQVSEEGGRGLIRLYLKYNRLGESVIQTIRRESKPGRRVYRGVGDLEPVLRGIGIAIVSTPKGILSDRECRREKVGGEVLCSIW